MPNFEYPAWSASFLAQTPDGKRMDIIRSRYKVFFGGRGAGRSWTVAQALVQAADRAQLTILCAREVQLSIKYSSKKLIDDTIKRAGLSNRFESTLTEIKNVVTGSLFIFKGLNDTDSIKSAEGIDICWIEEANTVSQKSIDDLRPTIRKEGSEIWFTFNPKSKDDPVYKLFIQDNPPPNSIVRFANYDENPFFPDVLRTELEWDAQNDPDKFRHIWLGEPVQHTDAQVFAGRWKIAECPEPPRGTVFYHGADWGFSKDPTTLVRCWIDGRTLYVDRGVRAVGVEIDHTPALFDQIETARKWEIIADSARPELISYMNRNGFRIKASKKGAGSVEDGITYLRQYNIVINPDLKWLIDEFFLYSYKVDKKTGQIMPEIVDANNHGVDSLRYSCEALMKDGRSGFLMMA